MKHDTSEPKEKCKGKVWRDYAYYPCHRDATKDGYCWRCNPEMRAARTAKRDAAYRERVNAEKTFRAQARAIAAAERRVIEAAETWRDFPIGNLGVLGDAVDALREARKGRT